MVKKIVISVVIILIFILIFILFKSSNNEFSYTPISYKICDNDSCIYLVGSIHIGDDRVDKISNKIIKLYNKSNILAVELDINEINIDVSQFMLENGSIDNYISEDLNQKLIDFSNEHILFSFDTLKYMKLGYIYDYISLMPYLEEGYINDGVDNYFINKAKEDNKEIISLETYEEQLNLLLGYSNDFYIENINYILDNYDEVKNDSINLYNVYLNGDIKELENILENEKNVENQEFIKDMYDNRNINMTKKVEEFLLNNDNVFMVVGCAHVIGDNGIIDSLKDKYEISLLK